MNRPLVRITEEYLVGLQIQYYFNNIGIPDKYTNKNRFSKFGRNK